MDYKCTVCGKSVTPASYQYCIKNEYPVLCHKHQQELGYNRYQVLTEVEKQVSKEQAEKEKAEQEAREQHRKNNLIPLIEKSIEKILIKREYHYAKALLHDLEEARKQNVIDHDTYNKYLEIYYANKDKKELTSKQKEDIWKKEIIKEIEAIAKSIYNENKEKEILYTIEQLKKDLKPIQDKYIYLDYEIDEYMTCWSHFINELSNGFCSYGDIDNFGKTINEITIY